MHDGFGTFLDKGKLAGFLEFVLKLCQTGDKIISDRKTNSFATSRSAVHPGESSLVSGMRSGFCFHGSQQRSNSFFQAHQLSLSPLSLLWVTVVSTLIWISRHLP